MRVEGKFCNHEDSLGDFTVHLCIPLYRFMLCFVAFHLSHNLCLYSFLALCLAYNLRSPFMNQVTMCIPLYLIPDKLERKGEYNILYSTYRNPKVKTAVGTRL